MDSIIALLAPAVDPAGRFFLLGVALVGAGAYLQWRVHDAAMEAEEKIKDGDWTDEEARRHLLLLRIAGPALITAGAVVLVFAVAR